MVTVYPTPGHVADFAGRESFPPRKPPPSPNTFFTTGKFGYGLSGRNTASFRGVTIRRFSLKTRSYRNIGRDWGGGGGCLGPRKYSKSLPKLMDLFQSANSMPTKCFNIILNG